jgi:hypothetical protein
MYTSKEYNQTLQLAKQRHGTNKAIKIVKAIEDKQKREMLVNQAVIGSSLTIDYKTSNNILPDFSKKIIEDKKAKEFNLEIFFENKDLYNSISSNDFLNKLIKLSYKDIKELSYSISKYYLSIFEDLRTLKASDNVLFGLKLKDITGSKKLNKIKRLCNSSFLIKKITQIYNSFKDTSIINRDKLAGSYISNFAKKLIEEKKKKQFEYLSSITIMSKETGELLSNKETGEVMTLADLNSSDQKQKQKLNELYCIQKNLEKLADNKGYTFLFITLTVPASFKPAPKNGNCSYDKKSSVKDGVRLLNDCFSNFRKRKNDFLSGDKKRILKKFKDKTLDNDVFGFWSKEPQADGTPHSHFLMYLHPSDVELIKELFADCVRSTFEKQGLKYSKKHTLDIVGDNGVANPSTYIFKYIMKALSIKTYNVEATVDKEGNVLKESHTVEIEDEVSSGCADHYIQHRYRRYDTFGVDKALGAWRELKRLSLHEDLIELAMSDFEDNDKDKLQELIDLAQDNDFLTFLEIYKKSNVKVNYNVATEINEEGEEYIKLNEYGEDSKSPSGLMFNDIFIKTRKEYIFIKLN